MSNVFSTLLGNIMYFFTSSEKTEKELLGFNLIREKRKSAIALKENLRKTFHTYISWDEIIRLTGIHFLKIRATKNYFGIFV